ncbi:HEAT repeat domain-containing protein [Salinigranum marinum]|uniref:HEAT repeat domain-containing protein n=1 Tax=Salinigranum marinum TaxID=1515595 RepID=UPI002989E66D|nr:HEAT repeat domain-containing protein [Salinigranum marinum]
MSDGDDADDANEADEEPTAESLEDRLTAVEEELDAAESEDDLDAVEATLDGIAADIEAADLPEPDEDDEDADDPRADLEAAVEELRTTLDDQRGPYGEDIVAAIDDAKSTIEDTRWTEQGETEIADAVTEFVGSASDTLAGDVSAPDGDDQEALLSALDGVADAVDAAGFGADEDAEAIAALLEATDALSAGLDDAQEWDDLLVHEQLEAQGFYDCLGHYKDYPPEWSALKEWEKRGNVEMILLGLETFDSGFMEEHCLEAITRMGDPGAFDEMHARAQKRGKPAITALGKMGAGAEGAVETLLDYVDADSDAQLQKVTFKALGEIGSEEATQPLADKLVMENDKVRPYAARALGLIGDTRAVKPLTETLADDDSDKVRAAAAWALRQIGTESALEAAAEYTDDRVFTVQHEAELARETLDAAGTDAAATTA